MDNIKLTQKEWNRCVDDLLERDKKLIGKISIPIRGGNDDEAVLLPDKLVTESMISAYAAGAMGDPDSLFIDPQYGKRTIWGGMIAPPTFLSWFGPFYVTLNPIEFPVRRWGWHGSTKFDYSTNVPIRPGDEISVVLKYGGYQDNTEPGKPYRLLDILGKAICRNQRNEIVGSVDMTFRGFLTFPYDKSQDEIVLTDMHIKGRDKKPRYSQEQLDAIYRFYDDELEGKHRRGAQIRYWEDVNAGEEIPTLIEGPLQNTDVYMSGIGRISTFGSFAAGWQSIKYNHRRVIDPETGVFKSGVARHFNDADAQAAGYPFAYIVGQNEGSISHAVCNWKGDDAWVRSWEVQHRTPRFLGDMAYIKGKISQKYIEDGEHLVDLDVWQEIQTGLRTAEAKVTVRLLSRKD